MRPVGGAAGDRRRRVGEVVMASAVEFGCDSALVVHASKDDGDAADNTWLKEGMDPKSSFLLKIRLFGDPKKVRKEGLVISYDHVVDSDLTNFKDLVEDLVALCHPRYREEVHVHYCDESSNTFPEVKSDQELVSMFNIHAENKVVHMVIAYWDSSVPYEPNFQAVDATTCEPTTSQPPLNNQQPEPVEDTYLLNPEPENEHVGVDEESIYLQKQPAQEHPACADNDKDKDYVLGSESEVEDGENYEPESDTYDKEDPPMSVGSTYRNMEEFKLALAQHAVKNEFEYMIGHSEPSRFRAYCARKVEDTCNWRIHASTSDGLCSIQVKKNPCAHACYSTRRKKTVRNASKHWIAAKVKDWLVENPNLGRLKGTKGLVREMETKGGTNAQFVRSLGTTGTTAERVTQKILQLCWLREAHQRKRGKQLSQIMSLYKKSCHSQ